MKRDEATAALESLTTSWRGDETETEALQLLAGSTPEENRYRDAFQVMRTALVVHPRFGDHAHIQDEAAATFERLFLAGKGDALPAIDALSLFYDFRELTPIGRRGDEMIRRSPTGWSRSICSIRRPSCCSIRSTTACKARRARRSRRVSL